MALLVALALLYLTKLWRQAAPWIWPLLGFLFLPFATLMYVILWRTGGITGFDWFWIGLAVFLDVGHWAASFTQRRQMPGYPQAA